MAAPTLIQSSSESSGAGSATVSLTGVTAGSTIVVRVWQLTNGARSYSATSYTVAAQTTGSLNQTEILYRENVASGTHNITVVANTGTITVNVQAEEYSACTFVEGDFVVEAGSNSSHDCSSTGLDVAADGLIVSGGVLASSGTALTATSGATRLGTATARTLWQYETANAGFVAEKSTWTSANSRQGFNVSAAFQTTASGGYTLVCDGATFAVTGQDASLIASRLLTADQASFALSGQDASLTASRLLTANNASFSLSGQDATLVYSGSSITYTLTCDQGTFALSGQNASLLATRLLTLDNGTFTLNGQDATLSYSGQSEVPYLELDFVSGNAATGTLVATSATGSLVALQATGTLVVTDTEI